MIWLGAALACVFVLGRRWRAGPRPAWLAYLVPEVPLSPPEPGPGDRLWELCGVLAAGAAFGHLQWVQPFAFAQVDAKLVELPGMLAGCRAAWAGHFPEWNPFVCMGAPLASVGLWSLTYPPTYAAYAVARHLLGDEGATLEVFAALHLAAGYVLARRLGERLNLSAPVAVLAALSFCLAGFFLVVGRYWHTAVPLWAWLPAAGLCVARLGRGPVGAGWALAAGGCVAGVWHAGFPQFAATLGLFALLACAARWADGGLPARRLRWLVPAGLLAAALSAPLAWCQFDAFRGASRAEIPAETGHPVGVVLAAALPIPLQTVFQPLNAHPEPRWAMGAVHFLGGLLPGLFLASLLAAAALGRSPGAAALCGAAGLWLALGDEGGLWWALAQVPGVGRLFRWPVRVLPFAALPVVLAGAGVLERWLRARRQPARAALLTVGPALVLLALHVGRCSEALDYPSFRPFPAPPAGRASRYPRRAGEPRPGRGRSRRRRSPGGRCRRAWRRPTACPRSAATTPWPSPRPHTPKRAAD